MRSIQQENETINVYAPNTGTPIYVKQILIEIKKRNSNTIIVDDFNTKITWMNT